MNSDLLIYDCKAYWINPLSTSPTKLSNRLIQFVGKLSTNCLSVFDHFGGLALEWLSHCIVCEVRKQTHFWALEFVIHNKSWARKFESGLNHVLNFKYLRTKENKAKPKPWLQIIVRSYNNLTMIIMYYQAVYFR